MAIHAKHKTSSAPRPTPPGPHSLVPALLAWFAAHARDLPWRRTRDPYAIWVSEIMLQQTQVKTVIPYWERWLRELPTLESLAQAKPEKIHKLWEGLGYYTRVRNMQKAAQQICDRHGGVFPGAFDAIFALPGIGRYTAGAIASIAFNQPAPILDGNVIRVLTRLHGIAEDPQEKHTNARLWQLAAELVTQASRITHHASQAIKFKRKIAIKRPPPCSALNQSLMELGALICTPRSPNCAACPVARHCVALRDDRVFELPRPKQRAAITARRFLAFIIERNGRFLVQQRAEGDVNAHLWEFPNVELFAGKGGARHPVHTTLRSLASCTPETHAPHPADSLQLDSSKPLCIIKHSITRYRLTTEAYRVTPGPSRLKLPGTWRTLAQLRKLPFTSAHRRILSQLEQP